MLIEVKAKVSRIIDGKTRKRTETWVVDRELFAEAEYAVISEYMREQESGTVTSSEIQSLKISPIKEVANQFTGNATFIATLKDIWLDDDGTEKQLKYKVLLWADTPSQAMSNTMQLAREGYDMQIEGIKQVDYDYLDNSLTQIAETEEEVDNE